MLGDCLDHSLHGHILFFRIGGLRLNQFSAVLAKQNNERSGKIHKRIISTEKKLIDAARTIGAVNLQSATASVFKCECPVTVYDYPVLQIGNLCVTVNANVSFFDRIIHDLHNAQLTHLNERSTLAMEPNISSAEP